MMSGLEKSGDAPERSAQTTYPFAKKIPAGQVEGARRALAAIDAAREAAATELSREGVFRDVDRLIDDQSLPPLVSRFLDVHWRAYLVRLHCAEGENCREWNEAVKTMNDLTWIVQPKTDERSRRWLYKLLPQLFQRLHDGLNFLSVCPAAQDVFFAELSILVQSALNPTPWGEWDWDAGTAPQRANLGRQEQ
jgi:hypothetical protein